MHVYACVNVCVYMEDTGIYVYVVQVLRVACWGDCVYCIIGASLSDPHIDEFAANFPYIYIWRVSCHKSLLALILRVLASFVNPKTVHKL